MVRPTGAHLIHAKSLGEQNQINRRVKKSPAIDPAFVQIQDATLATTKLSKTACTAPSTAGRSSCTLIALRAGIGGVAF
jgi:hypothetical protein